MINAETKRRDQLLASYLQYMQTLRSEIALAMDCISASALTPLQESISRQEALCAELVVLNKALGGTPYQAVPLAAHASLPGTDAATLARLRETGESLRQANLDYAALLKHSGRSLALLSSLCRTHAGQHPEAREPRSKYQTWSCEM